MEGADLFETALCRFQTKIAFRVRDGIADRRDEHQLGGLQHAAAAFQARQPHHLRHRIPAWIDAEHPSLTKVPRAADVLGVEQSQLLVASYVCSDVERLKGICHAGAVRPYALTLERPDHPFHVDIRGRRNVQLIADRLRHRCGGVPRHPSRIAVREVSDGAAQHHAPGGRGHRAKPGSDYRAAAKQLLMSRLLADSRLEGGLDPLTADSLVKVFLEWLERTYAGRWGGQKQGARTAH